MCAPGGGTRSRYLCLCMPSSHLRPGPSACQARALPHLARGARHRSCRMTRMLDGILLCLTQSWHATLTTHRPGVSGHVGVKRAVRQGLAHAGGGAHAHHLHRDASGSCTRPMDRVARGMCRIRDSNKGTRDPTTRSPHSFGPYWQRGLTLRAALHTRTSPQRRGPRSMLGPPIQHRMHLTPLPRVRHSPSARLSTATLDCATTSTPSVRPPPSPPPPLPPPVCPAPSAVRKAAGLSRHTLWARGAHQTGTYHGLMIPYANDNRFSISHSLKLKQEDTHPPLPYSQRGHEPYGGGGLACPWRAVHQRQAAGQARGHGLCAARERSGVACQGFRHHLVCVPVQCYRCLIEL